MTTRKSTFIATLCTAEKFRRDVIISFLPTNSKFGERDMSIQVPYLEIQDFISLVKENFGESLNSKEDTFTVCLLKLYVERQGKDLMELLLEIMDSDMFSPDDAVGMKISDWMLASRNKEVTL